MSNTSTCINTLTADGEFCRHSRKNLPLPIEMQLSKNPKTFCENVIAFLESTLNFEHMSLMPEAFSKLLTPKDVVT